MKQILTTLFFLSTYFITFAQVPQTMSYQAVARDADGVCLQNETISIQISILGGSDSGPILYQERFEGNVETNAVGHFQIEIGAGNPQTSGQFQNFSDIPWNNQTNFLKVDYAPGATTAFEEVGVTQLLTVPYAKVAENGKEFSADNGDEYINFAGENGNLNVSIGGVAPNNGGLSLRDHDGNRRIWMFSSSNNGGTGYSRTYGANGNLNVELSHINSNLQNRGAIRTMDENGAVKTYLGVNDPSHGFMTIYGENGNPNIAMSTPGDPNWGAMSFRDENGNSLAGIGIGSDGLATITASLKNFRIEHPNDPTKSIWYACIEGPEAAAYERGTAQLENGEVFIPFPEHFSVIINPSTMTVNLTPRYADTYGLAVIEQTAEGILVKELKGGTGNFAFDWEVKAVRKGFEDFKVIRDRATDMDIFGEVPKR